MEKFFLVAFYAHLVIAAPSPNFDELREPLYAQTQPEVAPQNSFWYHWGAGNQTTPTVRPVPTEQAQQRRRLEESTLVIYDIFEVGKTESEYFDPNDMVLSHDGSVVFLLNFDQLLIINVTEKNAPKLIGELAEEIFECALLYQEKYLVVSLGYEGLKILDVENPHDILTVSQYSLVGTHFKSIDIRGSIVYAATSNSGIVAVELTNITMPIGYTTTRRFSPSRLIKAISDTHLLVSTDDGYLYVYEIESLNSIVPIEYYQPCLTLLDLKTFADHQTALVTCLEPLVLWLDVSNLPVIKETKKYFPDTPASQLVLSNDEETLYLATDTSIQVVLVSTARKLFSHNTMGGTVDIALFNDLIFTTELGIFKVLETQLIEEEHIRQTLGLKEVGKTAEDVQFFVLSQDETLLYGVQAEAILVFDITDVAESTLLERHSIDEVDTLTASLVNECLVLLNNLTYSIQIYSVADSFALISQIPLEESPLDIAVLAGNSLLAAAIDASLHFYTISDLSVPELASTFSLEGKIYSLAVYSDEYIVATCEDGMHFVNLRDVSNIYIEYTHPEARSINQTVLTSDQEHILAMDTDGTLTIYEITAIGQIQKLTTKYFRLPTALELSKDNKYVYVADWNGHLKTYDLLPDGASLIGLTTLHTGVPQHQIALMSTQDYAVVRSETGLSFVSLTTKETVFPILSAVVAQDGKEFKSSFYFYNSENQLVSQGFKLLEMTLVDSDLRARSPKYWITADTYNNELRLAPPSVDDLWDSYSIQINVSLPISASAFATISSDSITSSDIEVELIKLGYISLDGFLTNVYDSNTPLKLSRSYEDLHDSIHDILFYYKFSSVVTISTADLLSLNTPPQIGYSLQSQLDVKVSVGELVDFQFSSSTFVDADYDTLEYSATYQAITNGETGSVLPNPPVWLAFDKPTRRFYGTATTHWFLDGAETQTEPVREKILKITVYASDGYNSVGDSFQLVFINNIPVVSETLQSQFEKSFGNTIVHGTELNFKLSETTFFDADGDSLYYSALVNFGIGWQSLDTVGFIFDELTRSIMGTAENYLETDKLFTFKITVMDDEVSEDAAHAFDEFSFFVSTAFPDPAADSLTIESTKESETVHIYVDGGSRLELPATYNSATAYDLALNIAPQTEWEVSGNPEDVNTLLSLGKIRTTLDRRLSTDLPINLELNGQNVSYPLSIFEEAADIELVASSDTDYAFIGEQYSFELVSMILNPEELSISYVVSIDKPDEASDWLVVDDVLLSGLAESDIEKGEYTVLVTVIDEFGSQEEFTLTIIVDFTDFDKFMIALETLSQVLGVIIAIIGYLRYRTPVRNIARAGKFCLHPLSAQVDDEGRLFYAAQLPLLQPGEKKLAKKLLKWLDTHALGYPDDLELCRLIDRAVHEYAKAKAKRHNKDNNNTVSPPDFVSLLQTESFITINCHVYHPQYLFSFIRHHINMRFMLRNHRKEIKSAFKKLKSNYEEGCAVVYRNSWCRHLDVLSLNALANENLSKETFEGSIETEATHNFQKVFDDMIRYKVWKSTAVVCDKNDIDNILVTRKEKSEYHRKTKCARVLLSCLQKVKHLLRLYELPLNIWANDRWVKARITEDAVHIQVFPELGRVNRVLVLVVYDVDGKALAETELLAPLFKRETGMAFYEIN